MSRSTAHCSRRTRRSTRSRGLSPSRLYSTYLGDSGQDLGHGISVDAGGNAYVTGSTRSQDFPTTARALQKSLNVLQNVFVTKLNANGTALQYSTLLGGDDYDFGFGIAVDSQGAAYVTGVTYGIFTSTFPITGNGYQTAYGGGGDAFVSKLNADGSSLVYSTFLGGTASDGGRSVALDGNGAAYVTGFTTSSAFPITAGAFQTVLNGSEDAFVAKLSADGSGLVYSSFLGGSANGGSNGDGAYGVAVDSGDNAYVTGYTNSGDFPVSANAHEPGLVRGASHDSFVVKIASH